MNLAQVRESTSSTKLVRPKVSEFVNAYKSIRATRDEDEALDGTNKALAQNKGCKERAIMPARLKYLIRPSIKKVHFDPEDWKLITEDEWLLIWAQSFDIPCVNISQAEGFLFNKKHKITAPEPKNKARAPPKRVLENAAPIASLTPLSSPQEVQVSFGLHDDWVKTIHAAITNISTLHSQSRVPRLAS
jgi:hypothetical protein